MVISVNVDDVTLESTVQVPTVIKSFALSLYGSMHKIEPIYFQLFLLYIAKHCFHFTLPSLYIAFCFVSVSPFIRIILLLLFSLKTHLMLKSFIFRYFLTHSPITLFSTRSFHIKVDVSFSVFVHFGLVQFILMNSSSLRQLSFDCFT